MFGGMGLVRSSLLLLIVSSPSLLRRLVLFGCLVMFSCLA